MSMIGLLTATEKQVVLGFLFETYLVAPKELLAFPRILGEDYISASSPVVAR